MVGMYLTVYLLRQAYILIHFTRHKIDHTHRRPNANPSSCAHFGIPNWNLELPPNTEIVWEFHFGIQNLPRHLGLPDVIATCRRRTAVLSARVVVEDRRGARVCRGARVRRVMMSPPWLQSAAPEPSTSLLPATATHSGGANKAESPLENNIPMKTL